MTSKVKKSSHAKYEKVKTSSVAFDPSTNQLMSNQSLFNSSSQTQREDFNHKFMFTALITKELKQKFDSLYKTYKEGLCDIAEIDHHNVKELLLEQAKEFFA